MCIRTQLSRNRKTPLSRHNRIENHSGEPHITQFSVNFNMVTNFFFFSFFFSFSSDLVPMYKFNEMIQLICLFVVYINSFLIGEPKHEFDQTGPRWSNR